MFDNCTNEIEVKFRFRQLAKLLHPDHGGTDELMVALYRCRDKALEEMNFEGKKEWREKWKKKSTSSKEERIHQDDERLYIVDIIYLYSSVTKSFESEFFDSVRKQLMKKESISWHQYQALKNIYESFRLKQWWELHQDEFDLEEAVNAND